MTKFANVCDRQHGQRACAFCRSIEHRAQTGETGLARPKEIPINKALGKARQQDDISRAKLHCDLQETGLRLAASCAS